MHCKSPEALPENDTRHIVTAITNPVLWHSRYRLARAAILDWLKEPNVRLTIVEVAHGERSYCLCDLACDSDRVIHIEVYAKTMAWSKECCLNLGIARLRPVDFCPIRCDSSHHEERRGPRAPCSRKRRFIVVRNSTASIDPLNELVTLAVGTFPTAIPPGSFKEHKKGFFSFRGTINGVSPGRRSSQPASCVIRPKRRRRARNKP